MNLLKLFDVVTEQGTSQDCKDNRMHSWYLNCGCFVILYKQDSPYLLPKDGGGRGSWLNGSDENKTLTENVYNSYPELGLLIIITVYLALQRLTNDKKKIYNITEMLCMWSDHFS